MKTAVVLCLKETLARGPAKEAWDASALIYGTEGHAVAPGNHTRRASARSVRKLWVQDGHGRGLLF